MQALSHFSYDASGGQLILCDLQGGPDATGGAVLTDPAILSLEMTYGGTDMGADGMYSFFNEHVCNSFCDENWLEPGYTAPFLRPVGATTRWDGTTARYVDEDGTHTYVPRVSDTDEEATESESADGSQSQSESEVESELVSELVSESEAESASVDEEEQEEEYEEYEEEEEEESEEGEEQESVQSVEQWYEEYEEQSYVVEEIAAS